MTRPDIVQSALGDEGVAARVDLGDDALFVTPTRTILYHADKLLSDESVEEYPHGAERITVSPGRRKSTVTLDYGLDGERTMTVPSKTVDRALHPVLAGTLNAVGVTDPGETIKETFRFSELTLVITSDRLVKHIGNAVWDEEFEEFHYDDVTDLAFEEGSVATTVVLTLAGRQERFKAPNERAREVRERLTEVVLAHHGVDSVAELRERFAPDADAADEPRSSTVSFGDGPTPLSVNPGELAEQPANATRNDEDADTDEREREAVDAAPTPSAGGDTDGEPLTADAANATGATAPSETTPDEGEAAERAGTTAAEPTDGETDGSTRTAESAGESEADRDDDERTSGLDTIETGDLLGPQDDGESRSSADPGARDDELAALAAEVEALRESVEAQNERIARQEELIERLIVELRNRL
ncbi:DUF7115 domain-containing protein [Salinigranum marinum]|uniref:DUF7115 domain-containing protein n=1 Tax=Salinigranum marinum TaxID=1515595 RepID=UPI002989BDFD|nr:hypothetical protein [Salinigranum marinum]